MDLSDALIDALMSDTGAAMDDYYEEALAQELAGVDLDCEDVTGKLSIDKFDSLAVLGEGSFSQVHLMRRKESRKLYAVKCLNKQRLVRLNKTETVFREKSIMYQLKHSGVVRLRWTLQDEHSLYLVMDLCPHGELANYICEGVPLERAVVRDYVLELIDIFVYLHKQSVVHRDVKPENIFFDALWHMKLGDFGSARELKRMADGKRERAYSFVGSVGYLAPELIAVTEHTKPALAGINDDDELSDADSESSSSHHADAHHQRHHQHQQRHHHHHHHHHHQENANRAAPTPEAPNSTPGGVGLRADVFGLGCVVQLMTTGRAPYASKDLSEFQILEKTRRGDRRKPPRHTNKSLQELLDAMLNPDPRGRPPARRLRAFRYLHSSSINAESVDAANARMAAARRVPMPPLISLAERSRAPSRSAVPAIVSPRGGRLSASLNLATARSDGGSTEARRRRRRHEGSPEDPDATTLGQGKRRSPRRLRRTFDAAGIVPVGGDDDAANTHDEDDGSRLGLLQSTSLRLPVPRRASSLSPPGSLRSSSSSDLLTAFRDATDHILSYISEDAAVERHKSSVWAPFLRLDEGETIVASDLVFKRRRLFALVGLAHKELQLILTTAGRLLVVDSANMSLLASVYCDQVESFEVADRKDADAKEPDALLVKLKHDDSPKVYQPVAVPASHWKSEFDRVQRMNHH